MKKLSNNQQIALLSAVVVVVVAAIIGLSVKLMGDRKKNMTPEVSMTPTILSTPTPEPSLEPTETLTPTPTFYDEGLLPIVPASSPTPVPTEEPAVTPEETPSVTPDITPSLTPEVTPSLTPGLTAGVTPVVTPTESVSKYLPGDCSSITVNTSESVISENGWDVDSLMLVNWDRYIRYSGSPTGLVKISSVLKKSDKLVIDTTTDIYLNKNALDALESMLSDAFRNGASKVVINANDAYCSYEYLNQLWEKEKTKNSSYGNDPYLNPVKVLPASANEHRTGLSIDLQIGNSDYSWFSQNCYKYGYVLRYPQEKSGITGVKDRTNHFRFVGVDAASEMHNLNMCLEEYIAYKNNRPLPIAPTRKPDSIELPFIPFN